MIAIYKRELRAYFQSFIGLLFVGVSLFFVGLYFTVYNLMYGSPYVSYAISSVAFVFMITVPVLCMKVLAEERHNKTDQLTITAPVTVGQIVLGKYLALLTVFAVPTLVTCLYPLILQRYSDIPMGEAYTAILAYFLYGAAAIAIGMLMSSLTESQVIAAVLGFGVLFLGYMMSNITGLISATGNWLTKILGCYDMYTPFAKLLNGTLDLGAVVYFVSVAGLALFLTTQVIQKRRYSVSVKQLGLGAYSTGMIAVAIAVTLLANMVMTKLPGNWTAIDVTDEQLYSLTEESKTFLKNLKEDVTLYVMVKEENQDTIVGETLARYEDYSDHITVTYVDPVANPTFAKQFTTASISSNSVIVVGEKRSKVVSYSDMFATEMDQNTYQYYTTGYDGEGQMTGAIAYVVSDDLPKVYLTTGHGESYFSTSVQNSLQKNNVEFTTVNLMDHDVVPEDTSCLVIFAPASDFSSDDTDKVLAYLDKGGKVIFISGNYDVDMTNCKKILEYMNITLEDGLVVESDNNRYYQTPIFVLPEVSASTYTVGVNGRYYVLAPYAQGFTVPEDSDTITYEQFLTTSDKAYSKVNLASAVSEKEDADIEGPFAIGVAAEKQLAEGSAMLVAYSCSGMFTDQVSSVVSGSNQTILVNTVSAFADNEITGVIPVKSYTASYVTMSQSDFILIGGAVTILVPLGCVIAGFVIWYKRRRK